MSVVFTALAGLASNCLRWPIVRERTLDYLALTRQILPASGAARNSILSEPPRLPWKPPNMTIQKMHPQWCKRAVL